MRPGWCAVALALLAASASVTAAAAAAAADDDNGQVYTHQWVAHIDGDIDEARTIASNKGFHLLAEIFPGVYHLVHHAVAKRSAEPSHSQHGSLLEEEKVLWARQEVARRRVKRSSQVRPHSAGSRIDDLSHPDHEQAPQASVASSLDPKVARFLNDPRWPQMWYLNRGSSKDMNVISAWMEGITGKGVTVTILDDGLETDHPDLAANYDPMASYDVNNHDEDPTPRYDILDSNRHGTRCAGEVAAVANNSLCSVGVAFGASVGGVRMLDGDVTDAVEARSLSLNPQHVDIYSASWGPDDDGKTVDGPGELATRAFHDGVTRGRGGRGSIFVWASGNGGRDNDNCNCDGYTNAIWTLSISSATEYGKVPWYSEACSSTLATTYSSGQTGEKQVVTVDLHRGCTSSHTGTSASAPLAAGICALALEANQNLTWRDMQHIVVRTARPAHLRATDWAVNGVGRNVSHSFGYGLMDALAMVRLARTWKTVPPQRSCEVAAPQINRVIPPRSQVQLQLDVRECEGVSVLEHVQARVSLTAQRRGDLQIMLTSPSGTRAVLLARRPQDTSRSGFTSWPFMSVHTWGEKPTGVWRLEIHNEGRQLGRANLQEWALVLYGTTRPPPFDVQTRTKPSRYNNARPSVSPALKSPPPPAPPPGIQLLPSPPRKGKKPGRMKGGGVGLRGRQQQPAIITTQTKPKVQTLPPTPSKATTPSPILGSTPASSRGITILLAPPSQVQPRVPAAFQRYSKIQQLVPYSHEDAEAVEAAEAAEAAARTTPRPVGRPAPPFSVTKPNGSRSQRPTATPPPAPTTRARPRPSKIGSRQRHQGEGTVSKWTLKFYGTETLPGVDGDIATTTGNEEPVTVKNVLPKVENAAVERHAGEGIWRDLLRDVAETPGSGHSSFGTSGRSKGGSPTTSPSSALAACSLIFLWLLCLPRRAIVLTNQSTSPAAKNGNEPPCHYSCLTCSGPNDYECNSCHGDAVLRESFPGEHFCYPASLEPMLEADVWYRIAAITSVIFCLLLVIVILILYYHSTKRKRIRAGHIRRPSTIDRPSRTSSIVVPTVSPDSDDSEGT